jgi:hypothetical protein
MDAYDRFFYEIMKIEVEDEEMIAFARALSSAMQMAFMKKGTNPDRFRDYLQQMMNEYYKGYKK